MDKVNLDNVGSGGNDYSDSNKPRNRSRESQAEPRSNRPPISSIQIPNITNHNMAFGIPMTSSGISTLHGLFPDRTGYLGDPNPHPFYGMHLQRSMPSPQHTHQSVLSPQHMHQQIFLQDLQDPGIQNWLHRPDFPQSSIDNSHSMRGGGAFVPNRSWPDSVDNLQGQIMSDPSVNVSEIPAFQRIFLHSHPQDLSFMNMANNNTRLIPGAVPQHIDRNTQALLQIQQQHYENLLHQQAQLLNIAMRTSASVVKPSTAGYSPNHHQDDASMQQASGLKRIRNLQYGMMPKPLNMMSLSEVIRPRRKKQNKKRDPLRPKRPLSAYNVFFRDEREKILSKAALGPIIPNKRYDESSDFVGPTPLEDGSSNPDSSTATADLLSMKKDAMTLMAAAKGAISPPPFPYSPQNGKIGFEAMGKMIGQRWSLLKDTDRQVYHELAQEDMKRYKEEMELYWISKKKNECASDEVLKDSEE